MSDEAERRAKLVKAASELSLADRHEVAAEELGAVRAFWDDPRRLAWLKRIGFPARGDAEQAGPKSIARVPSSHCFKMKAFCASENRDAVMLSAPLQGKLCGELHLSAVQTLGGGSPTRTHMSFGDPVEPAEGSGPDQRVWRCTVLSEDILAIVSGEGAARLHAKRCDRSRPCS